LRGSSEESVVEQLPPCTDQEDAVAAAAAAYADTKAAYKLAVDAHDEVEKQQQADLAAKPKGKKGPDPAAQAQLDEFAEAVADRRKAAEAAKKKLEEAERALTRERQRNFIRVQSARNVLQSRLCADSYATAFEETNRVIDHGKAAHADAKRRAQLDAQKAAMARAQKQRALHFATNLDTFASGYRIAWRNNLKFAPAQRAPPTKWLKPEPPPADEPAALTALKKALGQSLPRVVDLFNRWDVDCDHTIGIDELRLALGALKVPHDEKTLMELFDQLDADRSGSIDFEELHHALRKHAPKREPPNYIALTVPKRREPQTGGTGAERRAVAALKRRLSDNRLRVRDLFAQWDIDSDGQVTIAELQRALAGLCIPIDKPALKRLFAQIDTDGSGSVDYTELEALLKNDRGEEDIIALAKEGAAKSGVRHLTRPQSSPNVGRSMGRSPHSRSGSRPVTPDAIGGSFPVIGRPGADLARPRSVPQNMSLGRRL